MYRGISIDSEGCIEFFSWNTPAPTCKLRASTADLEQITSLLGEVRAAGAVLPHPGWDWPDNACSDCLFSMMGVTYGGFEHRIDFQRRRVALPLWDALLSLQDVVERKADEAWKRGLPLAPKWSVNEYVSVFGPRRGTWTRRGETNIFDAVWQDDPPRNEVLEFVARYRYGPSGGLVEFKSLTNDRVYKGYLDIENPSSMHSDYRSPQWSASVYRK